MLLPFPAVARALVEGRCVFSRAVLGTEESVVSAVKVKSLYSGRLTAQDKDTVRELVRLLVIHGTDLALLREEQPHVSVSLQRFFGLCLRQADAGEEAFLHAYVFLFWRDVSSQLGIGRSSPSPARWTSREFGLGTISVPREEREVLDQIVSAGVEVDLITCDPTSQTLGLIEIKRGECDDRAVGQLLRYYQTVWDLLSRPEFRRLNLNYLWPVLIANRVRPQQLSAMPMHFRGLLDIITYDTSPDGIPQFLSFRKAAIASRWL